MSQPLQQPLKGNNNLNVEESATQSTKAENKTAISMRSKTESQNSDSPYVAMGSPKSTESTHKRKKSNTPTSRIRSYSIGSMADGNRRKNQENARHDADFFRFPQPKTLLVKSSNIGLYSQLVSTRRASRYSKDTSTIYDGVPSYLNPNLMRQRQNRSRSVKSNGDNGDNEHDNEDQTIFTRSQSERYDINPMNPSSAPSNALLSSYGKKKESSNKFGDYPLKTLNRAQTSNDTKKKKLISRHARNHSQSIPMIKRSYSYQELDDNEVDGGKHQWALYDEPGLHGPSPPDPNRKLNDDHLTVSYVKTAPQKRLLEDFSTIWKRAYFALVILAVLNGSLTFCISKAASQVWWLQSYINEYSLFQVAHGAPAYILLLLIKLSLVIGAIFLTRQFAPGCAGSGVPELRAILSGIWIRHYLSKTTYFVKIFALTLSLSSGVPIGLEGPFIHLSSIMGRQLTKLKVFAHLDRKQMLSAACAGGLASVFGSPIGGVLFSIEVTSTYYPVTNYWTAFCCAMVGSTMTHVFQQWSPTSLLLYQNTFSDAGEPLPRECLFFALLGLVGGIMGVGFIYFHDIYVALRRKYQSRFLGDNPYGIAIVVVVFFTTILFFIGDFAIEPARKAVADMFNIEFLNNCDEKVLGGSDGFNTCEEVDDWIFENPTYCEDNKDDIKCQQNDYCHCFYHDWAINGGLYANLIAFYVLNFFFTIGAVTLSYPCGLFSPIFTLGSVIGRIFGEIFRHWFGYCDPRIYSVVGAAAMAAGVTQTISPAVIALEITQDLSLAVPCLLAVIMSGGVSTSLIHSFYDSVLQLRGIPMLPIRPTVAYKRIFIKPKRKKKPPKKTMSSPLSRMLSNNDNNPPPMTLGSSQMSESDIDFSLDRGRLSVDSQPEVFHGDRSKEKHVLVLNASMKRDKKNSSFQSLDNDIKAAAMYRLLIADDVMFKEFSFVTIDPTVQQLVHTLTNDVDQEWFPIVHTISEAVLVGEVRRSVLMDLLRAMDSDAYEHEIPSQLRMNHMSFFDQTSTQIKDKASIMNDIGLLNEPTKSLINQQMERNRSKTLKQRVSQWTRKSVKEDDNVEPVEMNKDDDNKNDNDTESSSEEHKIKLTLMSGGFIERINLSPIQVISEMPLTKIYTLFHILKPQNVYVTKYSRLIGVINELQLLQREFETQQTSKKAKMYCLKCQRKCRDCKRTICCCC